MSSPDALSLHCIVSVQLFGLHFIKSYLSMLPLSYGGNSKATHWIRINFTSTCCITVWLAPISWNLHH